MREESGDIWQRHDEGYTIVIPTNGTVTRTGELVMGRGLALQAMKRWRSIPSLLGPLVREHGNIVYYLREYMLFTFPVKEHWKDPASLDLIRRSAVQLEAMTKGIPCIYLPRVGCGNGRLEWKTVRPILRKILHHPRFVIIWCPEFRL